MADEIVSNYVGPQGSGVATPTNASGAILGQVMQNTTGVSTPIPSSGQLPAANDIKQNTARQAAGTGASTGAGDFEQGATQLGQGVGAAIGAIASDKRLKKNIKDTDPKEIDKFINSISTPKSFDYKDAKDGSHTGAGLMAQDLKKSQIGSSAVINTPKGMMVDTNKLSAMMSAVTAHKLHQFEGELQKALDTKFKGKR